MTVVFSEDETSVARHRISVSPPQHMIARWPDSVSVTGFVLMLKCQAPLSARQVFGRTKKTVKSTPITLTYEYLLVFSDSLMIVVTPPLKYLELSFTLYYTRADDFKFDRAGFQVILNFINKSAIVNTGVKCVSPDCEDGLESIVE